MAEKVDSTLSDVFCTVPTRIIRTLMTIGIDYTLVMTTILLNEGTKICL